VSLTHAEKSAAKAGEDAKQSRVVGGEIAVSTEGPSVKRRKNSTPRSSLKAYEVDRKAIEWKSLGGAKMMMRPRGSIHQYSSGIA